MTAICVIYMGAPQWGIPQRQVTKGNCSLSRSGADVYTFSPVFLEMVAQYFGLEILKGPLKLINLSWIVIYVLSINYCWGLVMMGY